jgi:membrane protease YdiL (CAAX protease family)
MIQGYRMEGPPPHGEPPPPPPEGERDWPPWLGFATLLAVVVVSNLIYAVILGASGTDDIDDPPAWVTLSSALVLQTSLIAGALGAAALYRKLRPDQFGLRRTRFWRSVGIAALGMVAFYILAAIWVAVVGDPEQSTSQDIGADESDLALIAAGVLFVVIAPIAEEFFFRGFFYGSLRTRMPTVLAALVCGVVFGIIHVASGIEAVPVLIALGVIFCLVREATGSLYPVIGMHALNNTFAYIGQTDVAPGLAAGLGGAMLVACALAPRLLFRREPAPA